MLRKTLGTKPLKKLKEFHSINRDKTERSQRCVIVITETSQQKLRDIEKDEEADLAVSVSMPW